MPISSRRWPQPEQIRSAAGQLVVLRHTWQILRQTAATMRPALPLGLLLAGRRGTRRERIRRKVGEEQELIGVEAFAARPVQPTQQQFQSMLHRLMVAVAAGAWIRAVQESCS